MFLLLGLHTIYYLDKELAVMNKSWLPFFYLFWIFGHFQRQADHIGFTFSVEYDKLTIVKANMIGVALTDIWIKIFLMSLHVILTEK